MCNTKSVSIFGNKSNTDTFKEYRIFLSVTTKSKNIMNTDIFEDYRSFLSMIAEFTDSFSIPSATNCSGVFPSFSF